MCLDSAQDAKGNDYTSWCNLHVLACHYHSSSAKILYKEDFFTCQKLKANFLVTRWLFLAALGSVYNHRRRVWCTNSSNLINCIWLLGFDDWGDFGLKTNGSDVANDISRAWGESGFTLTLQGCVCRYTGPWWHHCFHRKTLVFHSESDAQTTVCIHARVPMHSTVGAARVRGHHLYADPLRWRCSIVPMVTISMWLLWNVYFDRTVMVSFSLKRRLSDPFGAEERKRCSVGRLMMNVCVLLALMAPCIIWSCCKTPQMLLLHSSTATLLVKLWCLCLSETDFYCWSVDAGQKVQSVVLLRHKPDVKDKT